MTKGNANRALQTFIDKNRITMRIQGWVKRKEEDGKDGSGTARLLV
jgi:hypothetical protein